MKQILLIAIMSLSYYISFGQITKYSQAQITNIDFSLSSDNKLVITYDFIGGKATELFDVTFYVFTNNGNKLDAKTATGDLKNVSPCPGKKIYWDIGKDIAYLNESIYIEVEAEHINPKVVPYTSKSKAMMLSTLFPGAGSARIGQNRIHYLKGIIGYACIGLSVKYNNDAVSAYDSYQTEQDPSTRNDLITQTEHNLTMSNLMIYGVVTVWLVDYLNIMLMNNKTEKRYQNLTFLPFYDPLTSGPIFALKYTF